MHAMQTWLAHGSCSAAQKVRARHYTASALSLSPRDTGARSSTLTSARCRTQKRARESPRARLAEKKKRFSVLCFPSIMISSVPCLTYTILSYISLAQIQAMSFGEAKPLRSRVQAADQEKMVLCHFCGVSVEEKTLQQHTFWNIQCIQQQHESSGMSCRRAKRTARKLYDLRKWKMEQVLSEVRRSVASRPGAKAMAKPLKTTKRQSKSSS